MLSKLSDTTARICAVGGAPAGGSIEGFAEELFQRGYSKISVVRHARSAKRIVRWAVRQGLSTDDLCEQVIESFGACLSGWHPHPLNLGPRILLTRISASTCSGRGRQPDRHASVITSGGATGLAPIPLKLLPARDCLSAICKESINRPVAIIGLPRQSLIC